MRTEKEKEKRDPVDYAEYLCKKCGGWFLFEDFNLAKQECKNCQKRKERKKGGRRLL